MIKFKKFLILFFVFCLSLTLGCSKDKDSVEKNVNIYIGDDGYWYIDDNNTGFKASGEDGLNGINGKSAYELAVENGYTGTTEEWLNLLTNKDGSLNVYNKNTDEKLDCKLEVVNGKILLVSSKTEEIVTEYGTVNEIAYENKSYKDIFETNNIAPVNMNSKNAPNDTYADYSGVTTIQNEDYNTAPSAMKVEGVKSQQAMSSKSYTGDFYIASKVKCTRYEKGYIGIIFGTDSSKYEDTTLQFEIDEYLTCSSVQSLDADNIFIGSAISANLDGYIDDPVVIDLSIFKETPNKIKLDILYEKYIQIVNGEFEVKIDKEIVTTDTVYYLGDENLEYSNSKAKSTFMKYMNDKAKSIGMMNTQFVDAAGLYNTVTAYDLLRLGVYACSYDHLVETWHKNTATITVTGNNPRSVYLETTVASSYLEDYYFLFGGKTGTVSYQNLLAIVEGPDERLFVVVVIGANNNRFQSAKKAMDIAVMKYNNPNADISGLNADCMSAAVCLLPINNTKAYTDYPLKVLYDQDMHRKVEPASITKVMTAVCMLDFVTDINEVFMINDTDITSGSGNYFQAGDILSYKEALHAMMLPSSNTCAEAVATAVGHKILAYNYR